MNKVTHRIKFKDLIVVTTNKNKLVEINEILGSNHKVSRLDIPEIQSLDLDEVIKAKAIEVYKQLKIPVLVEDVSLEIKSLGGLPGTFVKYFIQTIGTEGTVALIKGKDTSTKVTNAVAIYDGNILKVFKGLALGTLSAKDKGINGFGFDKVFIPHGYKQTFAQMTPSLKNKISHRGKALKKVKRYLRID